jgi:tRNA-dihydrouridine synthase
MLRESGCAGASLARGALGAPWIFRQTMDLAARDAYDPVTTEERCETLVAHFAGLAEQYGESAALALMRQEGQYYARGMKGARTLRVAIQGARDADAFRDLVAQYVANEAKTH